MRRFFVVELLLVVALAGAFLMGNGVVGMVILDEHTRPLCEPGDSCANEEVCCPFNGEQAGVCHEESMCAEIAELTREQAENEEIMMQYPGVEANLWFQILIGGLIMVMVGYSYFEFKRLKR